ncbi:hypothetical protein L596_012662 [Steinernema carpocapsae]|uniref:Uncharacterized protein n=1 Tax=Steinernema carpocapsae TaxID=34508 RepID=A0A4U5NXR8_STECR|nr:hypothetical protein L596_012662 [Steinernema carpocapsae]
MHYRDSANHTLQFGKEYLIPKAETVTLCVIKCHETPGCVGGSFQDMATQGPNACKLTSTYQVIEERVDTPNNVKFDDSVSFLLFSKAPSCIDDFDDLLLKRS